MHEQKRSTKLLLLLTLCGALALATVYSYSDYFRYWVKDLAGYHRIEAVAMGSSSILSLPKDYFTECPNLARRGFASGTLDDLSHYLRYSPLPSSLSSVLIYAGENDIVYGDSITGIIEKFRDLADRLTLGFPAARIYIIKAKLAPARSDYHAQLTAFNKALDSLDSRPEVTVTDSALARQVIPQYYLDDGVHLNRKGYDLLLEGLPRSC